MKKWIASSVLLLCSASIAQAPAPRDGYVPSEAVAIQIAKAVLEGMQSKSFVTSQKPFHAELEGSTWIVQGRYDAHRHGFGGGGLIMRIDKTSGTVLGYYFNR